MNFSEKYNKGNPVLSERLKTLRTENNMTQESLAKTIKNRFGAKCTPEYISMIESSKRPLSNNMAYYFSRIFGVDTSYLLDETVVYRTTIEKNRTELQSALEEAAQESYLMYHSICCLAELNGYTVKVSDIQKEMQVEEVIGTIKRFMTFYQDGKELFSLSLDDANRFGNMLSDIFMSHIRWNIQK